MAVQAAELAGATRAFDGSAIVRVRATVAHDSYERLVEISCRADCHRTQATKSALEALPRTIEKPESLGLSIEALKSAAKQDEGVSEFSRFYLERREYEIARTEDERKRKKLEDEFTPRLEMTLVALEGKVRRDVHANVRYKFETDDEYQSLLTFNPSDGAIVSGPTLGLCSRTGHTVPVACLAKCEVTGAETLKHLLVQSQVSGRLALPEFTAICAKSGKRLLRDEVDISAVTGNLVSVDLLKTSPLSGRRAEEEYFDACSFTNEEFLNDELAKSEISGRRYRADQQLQSVVSGRSGHKQEFLFCYETRQPIAPDEAEKCEITGRLVREGVLEQCDVSGKRVLPIALDRCAITGKRALKGYLVSSSVSNARLLESIAIRSSAGRFCAASEAKTCTWSGRKAHPDDLRNCGLTGLPIHIEFATSTNPPRLLPLLEILDGVRRNSEGQNRWQEIAEKLSAANNGGKYNLQAAILSPDRKHLAICSELKAMLGMRVYQVGAIYDFSTNSIVGRISTGRRGRERWTEAR